MDGQIASQCPRLHRLLVQINGDLFPVYVDRVALVKRMWPAPRRGMHIRTPNDAVCNPQHQFSSSSKSPISRLEAGAVTGRVSAARSPPNVICSTFVTNFWVLVGTHLLGLRSRFQASARKRSGENDLLRALGDVFSKACCQRAHAERPTSSHLRHVCCPKKRGKLGCSRTLE